MDEERWMPALGYEGAYEVSDQGRVWSLPRRDARDRAHGGIYLKPVADGGGYLQVGLSLNGIARVFKIHRLVLEAFVGPRPEGLECRHLNGDQKDNRLENLRWGSPKENGQDRITHGSQVGLNKTHCDWGHPLWGANVSPYGNGRECLACTRARSRVRRAGGEATQELRDECYREIVERPGPRGEGQELCKRGHVLDFPNLVPSSFRAHGWRHCLACNRARSIAKRRGIPFTQELADHYYAQIMTTQTPAASAA